MYSPTLGTSRTWSSPTIALQVLSQHSVRTISIKICNLNIYNSQYGWLYLYKRLNGKLQNKHKHHVFSLVYVQKLEKNSQSKYAEYRSLSTQYIINTPSTWTLQFPHFKQNLLSTTYTLPDTNKTATLRLSKNKSVAHDVAGWSTY